mmetsp:Transcript_8085/g.21363  ORF Transcript_8085/g.21363 Transcript_8085/m.21363 type:complete len:450 (-) Transcript_8085:1295-2644(-)|eukprot:CAMPEP_0113867756 /NCGR_PEP_ID=MMETSP0780_2-20120614/599_1 /TAXON_ID=652834 /ORGANISM="Palpitomonas bilix" /LENGTH=449 /DNA_ID=CAMNT_0000852741 /DNA_START=41 /DNA_END=1390 /DNA_ORIENTATION=+ /assembly_acc=CAM_ASM_000599
MGAGGSKQVVEEKTPPPPPPAPVHVEKPKQSSSWFGWGSSAKKAEEERLRQEEEERQRIAAEAAQNGQIDYVELAKGAYKQVVNKAKTTAENIKIDDLARDAYSKTVETASNLHIDDLANDAYSKAVSAAKSIDLDIDFSDFEASDAVELLQIKAAKLNTKVAVFLEENKDEINTATNLETYMPKEVAESVRGLRNATTDALKVGKRQLDSSLPKLQVGEKEIVPSTAALGIMAIAYGIYSVAKARRFKTAMDIPISYFEKQQKIKGIVKAVNDGDNVRIRHTTWLRRSDHLPPKTKLSASTIHVRLAGIDAPERAHFGSEAQPFSDEALEHLRSLALDQKVTVQLLSRDQYQRAVGLVWVHWGPFGIFKSQLALKMLDAGFAELYTAGGKQYGTEANLRKLQAAEKKAKENKVGMWVQGDAYVRPGEHKAAMKGGKKVEEQSEPKKSE